MIIYWEGVYSGEIKYKTRAGNSRFNFMCRSVCSWIYKIVHKFISVWKSKFGTHSRVVSVNTSILPHNSLLYSFLNMISIIKLHLGLKIFFFEFFIFALKSHRMFQWSSIQSNVPYKTSWSRITILESFLTIYAQNISAGINKHNFICTSHIHM